MLVCPLQRFFSSSPLSLFPSLSLFQIFTFRAVLTFYSSFLSCCFITFKGSLFRHESTHVAFARIRDGLFARIFFSLSLSPLPSSSFPFVRCFSLFFPFFFFSNIRHFRPFHISRFSFIEIEIVEYTEYAASFTRTLINNASSTETVVVERGIKRFKVSKQKLNEGSVIYFPSPRYQLLI